jgi:hypothetical protein
VIWKTLRASGRITRVRPLAQRISPPPEWRWRVLAGALAALAACAPQPTPAAHTPLPTQAPSPTPQIVVNLLQATATNAPTAAPFTFPDTLSLGQHLSSSGSFTETETEAAGPMVCRIERDSCAFRLLVSNYDPRILFSQSEPPPYGAEDRMMHPEMVLPLSTLAELVEAEWSGSVQIMVTEAYDSLLDHHTYEPNRELRYSLHFEGRSIDLITWPPDIGRVGRLCALGLEAGFDWVHNEGDHCHASIRAESLCSVCSGRRPP